MRHSGLSLAAILLLASITIAQHTGGTAAPQPSTPAAPPPSSPTTFSTSSATSSASGSMVSHSSPSPPANAPEIHTASSPVAPAAHVTSGIAPGTDSPRSAPTAHIQTSETGHIVPNEKISSERKIVSAPRVGENPPETKTEAKPAPDLRRRVCAEGDCKHAAKKPESDLRRPVCLNGPCPCRPGQSLGKDGCTGPTVAAANQCMPGEFWNGAACIPSNQCNPGQLWNGASCLASSATCAGVTASASTLVVELIGLKAQVQDAGSQNPPGGDCDDLKLRQKGLLAEYEMVFNGASLSCRGTFLDPASLM
jgi:hypothetical protein